MRYMTKEWYEAMQKTDLHLGLHASVHAKTYSEAYYRKLYARKETEWLELQKQVAEFDVEDFIQRVFGDGVQAERVDGTPMSEEELETARRFQEEMIENLRADQKKRPPFDEEKEKKEFRNMQRAKIRRLQSVLPDEILRTVADIRVLALDVSSPEVKKVIRQFCKTNMKAVQRGYSDYDKAFAATFGNSAPDFVDQMELHDTLVTSCRKVGKDLVIRIDNGGMTDLTGFRLKNCIVLKKEASLCSTTFLYQEFYKVDGRYEIHFLMCRDRPNGWELFDFIVSADDVVLQR